MTTNSNPIIKIEVTTEDTDFALDLKYTPASNTTPPDLFSNVLISMPSSAKPLSALRDLQSWRDKWASKYCASTRGHIKDKDSEKLSDIQSDLSGMESMIDEFKKDKWQNANKQINSILDIDNIYNVTCSETLKDIIGRINANLDWLSENVSKPGNASLKDNYGCDLRDKLDDYMTPVANQLGFHFDDFNWVE